jgi:hypothetical protein
LINEITTQLRKALETHGMAVIELDNSISLDNGQLELNAEIFDHTAPPGNFTVVLEIQAYSKLLGNQPILECFAGVGMSRERAITDAFGKMLLGSFHVLIEGLANHTCNEKQVDIEKWGNVGATWEVYSGSLLTQGSGNPALSDAYPKFFSQLTTLFVGTVPAGAHWVRVFLGSYNDQIQTIEVLLDNELWQQGQALLTAQNWSCTADYQSLRHFFLALPVCDIQGKSSS